MSTTISTPRRLGTDITNTVNSPDRCFGIRPLKKQRLTAGTPSFSSNHDTIATNHDLSLSQRLKLRELGHHNSRLSYDMRWLDFIHEAKTFSSSSNDRVLLSNYCPTSTPFCIESFHNKPITAIGFEGGDIILLASGNNDSKGKLLGHSKSHHANSIFDMSISHDDNLLASSSDLCVKIYDCSQNKVVNEFMSGNSGSVKQCKFNPFNPSLLLSSTRSGTINLFDLRLSNPGDTVTPWIQAKGRESNRYSFTKCHDIKIGKLKRGNVSVTSLAWSGFNDYTAFSGGEADPKVKFWDLRTLVSKNKQTPSCVVEPPSTADGRHFGITSIISDPIDNKVWTMCRNGTVYSYYLSSPHQGLVDELICEDLAVTSFYCKMTVLNPTRHSKTTGSYIACGGDKGVVLFSKPTARTTYHSSKTHSVLLKNGHSREATGINYQQNTNSLMSISDDMSLRFWKPNEELYQQLCNQKLGNASNSPDSDWAGWTEIV